MATTEQPTTPANALKYPEYFIDVSDVTHIDVYEIHRRFNIQDPSGCMQHASKKLLLSGRRTGKKSTDIDVKEAHDTLARKLEMEGLTSPAPAPVSALPQIGQFIGGGYYAGAILVDGQLFGIVVAPKAEGETKAAWGEAGTTIEGASSRCDGEANTKAMFEAGSEAAAWVAGLEINGYHGWYLPAKDELELMYRHLKPTAQENYADGDDGINPSSEPNGEAYGDHNPTQTTIEQFREGGPEAFDQAVYWSSTQFSAYYAWYQYFDGGIQYGVLKNDALRARAVRRFKLSI